jgi:hypothetical protein
VSAGLFDYSVAGPAAWFDADVFTSNDPGEAAGWMDFDYLQPPFSPTPPPPPPPPASTPQIDRHPLGGGGRVWPWPYPQAPEYDWEPKIDEDIIQIPIPSPPVVVSLEPKEAEYAVLPISNGEAVVRAFIEGFVTYIVDENSRLFAILQSDDGQRFYYALPNGVPIGEPRRVKLGEPIGTIGVTTAKPPLLPPVVYDVAATPVTATAPISAPTTVSPSPYIAPQPRLSAFEFWQAVLQTAAFTSILVFTGALVIVAVQAIQAGQKKRKRPKQLKRPKKRRPTRRKY